MKMEDYINGTIDSPRHDARQAKNHIKIREKPSSFNDSFPSQFIHVTAYQFQLPQKGKNLLKRESFDPD